MTANTDIGIVKKTNQDSLTVKVINTSQGKMSFAVLCDGMGGLDKGEVASATVIKAFEKWLMEDFSRICGSPLDDQIIRNQWCNIIENQNNSIKIYGKKQGVNLGTTVVAMLLTEERYYILNVGDSRAYEITSTLNQITTDQTFVAREIALGNMTPEQAALDPRKNVLLQCVGASDEVYPEMFYGETKKDAVYMLCSDGFRHEITPEEIYNKFAPQRLVNDTLMSQSAQELIELNKQRQERDNISVVLIRTF